MHSLPADVQTHGQSSAFVGTRQTQTVETSLTHTDHRAALLALLTTFLRFAFVVVDDGDPDVLIRHDGGLE